MELFSEELKDYLEQHADPEPELLHHIDRQTNLQVPLARMLSGHFQGRVLSMLSKLKSPNRILEIGTFTGYATLCLAEGLGPNGIIHTYEINPELEVRLTESFKKSDFADRIILHIGNATELLPSLNERFDLVFIDADKRNNSVYFDIAMEKTNPGALIIVDNVLWGGKVLQPGNKDIHTSRIDDFNQKVASDNRVEKLILPVRDGLFLIRRK